MPGLHHAMPRPFGGDGEPVDLAREPDCEVADVDHLLHFAEPLRNDLSGLEGHDRAERLLGGPEFVADEPHQFAPSRRRNEAPDREGAFGARDDRGHVGDRRLRRPGDLRPVDRRTDDERSLGQFR